MNPSPEFLGIQLENSILCKHRKIAGRVETIFCEAAPIRLNDISRLKRLGPEPSSFDRCPECRQYVCNCLWNEHIHVRSNGKLNAVNPNAKSRFKVNVMPFKVRKWYSNYGNTFSTQMSWLKKPIEKMCFSENGNSVKNDEERGAKSTVAESNVDTLQKINCILRTPRKLNNDDYILPHKDNLERRRKTAADQKPNHHTTKSAKKLKCSPMQKATRQGQVLESAPAAKQMKYVRNRSTPKMDLPLHLGVVMNAAPTPIPPRSTEVMLKSAKAKADRVSKMTSYAHRVSELLQSRTMFGNQAPCGCHPSAMSNPHTSRLTKVSDAFNYPSRYNPQKTDAKDCRHKASDFLVKYKEAGVSRPACTIESLENMQLQAKERPFITSMAVNQEKYNAFYGDPRMLEQVMLQKIDNSAASGSNTASRSKCDRAQTSSNYDATAADAGADAEKENLTAFQVSAVESSLLRMEQDFGEALVQELVCELTDEVEKCYSRVQRLTYLFEFHNKINGSIHSSQSLSSLSDQHCQKNINLNLENAKTFCSDVEFSMPMIFKTHKNSGHKANIMLQALKNEDHHDSYASSNSYSDISITTVVVNPLKNGKQDMKSKEFDVLESYELELP